MLRMSFDAFLREVECDIEVGTLGGRARGGPVPERGRYAVTIELAGPLQSLTSHGSFGALEGEDAPPGLNGRILAGPARGFGENAFGLFQSAAALECHREVEQQGRSRTTAI